MLIKVSWRNIWRNKLRSLVVIASIVLGIWAGIFLMALNNGFVVQRAATVINNSISHIQIHNPEFLDDNSIDYYLSDLEPMVSALEKNPKVRSFTQRLIMNGMASSPTGGYGVKITGIDPGQESEVTHIHQKVIEGGYLEGVKKNPVLIGERLANKLKVKLRSKIVLTFQNTEGDIIAGAFRVAGIYKTVDAKYDEMNLFTKAEDIHSLLEEGPLYHEVAILANNREEVNSLEDELKGQFPGVTIRSWDEISPELGYYTEIMDQMMYIFVGIILLGLAFGIVNTMLMAVLERRRELGMLMSVGMNKIKVFTMIMLETLFLSLTGGPLGIFLSYLTITYFAINGMDLSVVSKGLENLGVSAILYPVLDNEFYFNIALEVVIIALLASIYPAIKALKLKPAEAVRIL